MKKSRICWIRILFPVFAVLLFSIFLLTIKVNAASDQDYFPLEQNKNGKIPENITNYLDNNFTENYYTFCYFEKKEANDFQPGHYYYYYRVLLYPKSSGDNVFYGEINNDLIHFSMYALDNTGVLFRRLSYYDNSPNNITVANNGGFAQFQNLVSSNYDTSKDYVSNFQVYSNNNPATRKIVLLYGSQDPVINDGDTIPEDSQKPIFSDYVPDWSNAPSFDNSSVEAGLNSVFSIIQWLGNNIKDTIVGTGKFTVDTVLWGMQMIINNIRGKLQELKTSIDNIVSGIGSLIDSKFGNVFTIVSSFLALGLDQGGNFSLTQMFTSLFVPSSQQLIQAVLDHDDFDFIGTSKIVLADAPRILSQLYNVTSTPIFHVPSCTFHGVEIGNFDISFAWFAPYKVYYDVIVSTFLVIAYIYWIFVSMHGHIRTTYTPGPQEEEYWRY